MADKVGMSAGERREEWEHFEDYHRAHGSLMADWPAAWRTWCRNWRKRAAWARGNGYARIARRLSGEIDGEE